MLAVSPAPPTLVASAAKAVAENLLLLRGAGEEQRDVDRMESLPSHLKDRVRELLLRRGFSSARLLSNLLHGRVTSLDLSECAGVSPVHLAAISARCASLRRLVLSETGAEVGVEHCDDLPERLRVVHLRRCRVGDEAVR